jgi:hypothetical protein
MKAYEVLARKAAQSGIPVAALTEVYDRGIGAWKTNIFSVRLKSTGEKNVNAPRSAKLGREQWAMARVNAFIDKKPTVYYGADDFIRRKYKLQ